MPASPVTRSSPHHPSHYRGDIGPVKDELYVVTMLSNPLRWRSRVWNYWQFEREVHAAGAILYTAEVAFGDRPHEITQSGNPHHLQLRTSHELWHKENALNLLISRLPPEAKYIAWIDADIQFTRPDWAQETIEALQHYQIVQPFSQAQDMDAQYGVSRAPSYSFCYCYTEGLPGLDSPGPLQSGAYAQPNTTYWHPGFAWAARREALDALGGLLDFAILGSADWHMATALIGEVDKSLRAPYTAAYTAWIREWERRAERHIRRDIGYVPGLILHHYHGKKINRGYANRHRLLRTFDPVRDIKRDCQGLWRLDPDNRELRDIIRRYNRARHEDD